MKMMDCVEVIVEKKSYTQDGVHRGMQGWICLEQRTEGYWLVNFPQCGEKEDIAEIMFNDEVPSKKRIEIRKLRKKGLSKEYMDLFLQLIQYISEV